MSYASFIAFVVSRVQERIDTCGDGEAAAEAAVFWERLLTLLAATEGDAAGKERWRLFATKAKSVVESMLGLAGDWLSDDAKRALALLKVLLDLLA
ncbi:MAG: hypothetical protein OXH15_16345 [Gammaproteobacteria bacterium]|nr:hypothetical protein [Gammaproteobacteria bacterium]